MSLHTLGLICLGIVCAGIAFAATTIWLLNRRP